MDVDRANKSPILRAANRVKAETKSKNAAALPLEPVAEELAFLRKSFKELIQSYATQVEGEIAQLQMTLSAEMTSRKKFPAGRVLDLRDMLMLLRNFDVKPAKGRRRDLKKIEALVEELQTIVQRWE